METFRDSLRKLNEHKNKDALSKKMDKIFKKYLDNKNQEQPESNDGFKPLVLDMGDSFMKDGGIEMVEQEMEST